MFYVADSAGHLGLVETYTPGRIVHFGNLEFIVDSHGELLLQVMASTRAQERSSNSINPGPIAVGKLHQPTLLPCNGHC